MIKEQRQIELQPEFTILMPCLNEAKTLGFCIKKVRCFLEEHNIQGEILVADNNSNDDSQKLATNLGTRLVIIKKTGYGNVLRCGMAASNGKYIIIGDSDGSYDFSSLMPFVEKLRQGYDLVVGNRFQGRIKRGAMPAIHKYFGNPVLTTIGRIIFKSPCKDFHCGLRGINKESVAKLSFQTTGFEFATEMIIRSTLAGLKITEVPITLWPDGRDRRPHLRSWKDGWLNLSFMLTLAVKQLFLNRESRLTKK